MYLMRRILPLPLLLFFTHFLSAECTKGNCFNGHGTYVYANGAKYMGDFQDGNPEGKGILYFANGNKYFGHWKAAERHGEGRMVFIEGHEYLGDFRHDLMHGYGVMTYSNGDRYKGSWASNRPNGEGIYYFRNGERYEGSFVEGRFHGKGVMFYLDGSRYVGQWANNKKHGRGTYYKFDGKVVTGEWTEGTRLEMPTESSPGIERNCNRVFCANGLGYFTYLDGTRYEGQFHDGEPAGQGTVYYASGDRYEGRWLHHSPHGRGVMYYANGRVVGAEWEYGNPRKKLQTEEALPGAPASPVTDSRVRIWAVVIGVGAYDYMPRLQFTDDDARQIYTFLKSPQGGALPDTQIRMLVDEQATRENIMQAMQQTFLQADANDVVIFYFSGHGLEGSFLPVDYDGYRNVLRHDEITLILHESEAKHKIVLADACHSGNLLAMKSPNRELLKRYYSAFESSAGGMALLMSSRGEEYSLEDGGLRSGVFSHFLVRGLRGAADANHDGIVVIDEIFRFVNQEVRDYTYNVQTPILTGAFDPNMPVSIIR